MSAEWSWRKSLDGIHDEADARSCYTMSLNLGVAGGIIIDGVISLHHPWRVDYYVAVALIGALWVLIFFTFPETAYARMSEDDAQVILATCDKPEHEQFSETERSTPKKVNYGQRLKIFSGTHTSESLLGMATRPWVLILLPTVCCPFGNRTMLTMLGSLGSPGHVCDDWLSRGHHVQCRLRFQYDVQLCSMAEWIVLHLITRWVVPGHSLRRQTHRYGCGLVHPPQWRYS